MVQDECGTIEMKDGLADTPRCPYVMQMWMNVLVKECN
jgi:hypothetical protein